MLQGPESPDCGSAHVDVGNVGGAGEVRRLALGEGMG